MLAGYALRQLIGEGGTATVYRAEHPTYGEVAVKVLREKLRTDRTAIARFLREATYGTRVQHPSVVRTIEIGEAPNGLHFLAIEWASGDLLERYARRNAPLPPEEVATIIRQIADAVHAAHNAGIIHRDLKPDNVMYDPETRHAKLLDFGIAADSDMSPEERLTRAGFFVGTLMYVAPEALSGALVTPAADQYSLATIAYYLLTGCFPYLGKNQREIFTQLLSQPPIPLNVARRELKFPRAVEEVVMRGLAREPERRFSNVLEFAALLGQAINAPPQAEDKRKGGLFGRMRAILGRDE
jgi:serine/threonine-protein kinase